MISLNIILAGLILCWVVIYTFSYGIWTWKRKNYLGAIAIFMLDTPVALIPLYLFFLK